jgi:hypothetical protein
VAELRLELLLGAVVAVDPEHREATTPPVPVTARTHLTDRVEYGLSALQVWLPPRQTGSFIPVEV